MISWALAWAATSLNYPSMMVFILFTGIMDVIIFIAIGKTISDSKK